MALLSGLPVPQMSSPTDRGRSGGRGMSNFINLMSLIQGGKTDAEKSKLAADKWTEQKAQEAAMMKGLDRVKEAMQFATTPNDRLNVLDKNPGLLTDPYTSGWVKQGLTLQKQIQDIRSGVQSAKVKVAETHVTNRFNDDFELIAGDPENDELVAAISFKRQNPTTMPDPEMIAVVAKAKQSLLQKQAVEKEAARTSRFGDASIKRLYTEDNVPVDILNRPGGVPERIPTHLDNEKVSAAKELEILKNEERKAQTDYRKAHAKYSGLQTAKPDSEKSKEAKAEADALAVFRDDIRAKIKTAQKPQESAAAPADQQKQNVTKDEYDKLKSGDLYWWNGKQIPKQ